MQLFELYDIAHLILQGLISYPWSPRPGGERREEEKDLEAADLEDLATAAEGGDLATAAALQIQTDCEFAIS